MNIDKSYLSRIIKSHEKSGYIIRKASATDLRSFELYLTLQRESAVKEFIKKDQRLKPRPLGRRTSRGETQCLIWRFLPVNILTDNRYWSTFAG